MQCPACGAACGPAATSACHKCGTRFDLAETGAAAVAIAAGADAAVTRLGRPAPVRMAVEDPDVTRIGRSSPIDAGATTLASRHTDAASAETGVTRASIDTGVTAAGPAPGEPGGPLTVGA